jgi:hypothetical protein
MRLTSLRKAGTAAVAGGLLLASGTTPIICGDDGSVSLVGFELVGDLAKITLFNPGFEPVTGDVVIEVMIEGRMSLERESFSISERQKVCVQVDFRSPKAKVIQVGIILDDGAPI